MLILVICQHVCISFNNFSGIVLTFRARDIFLFMIKQWYLLRSARGVSGMKVALRGSGIANFDTFEANPYETKNQRRELQVKSEVLFCVSKKHGRPSPTSHWTMAYTCISVREWGVYIQLQGWRDHSAFLSFELKDQHYCVGLERHTGQETLGEAE